MSMTNEFLQSNDFFQTENFISKEYFHFSIDSNNKSFGHGKSFFFPIESILQFETDKLCLRKSLTQNQTKLGEWLESQPFNQFGMFVSPIGIDLNVFGFGSHYACHRS